MIVIVVTVCGSFPGSWLGAVPNSWLYLRFRISPGIMLIIMQAFTAPKATSLDDMPLALDPA